MPVIQRRRGQWLLGAVVLVGALSPCLNRASHAFAGEEKDSKPWCEMEVVLDFDLDEARTQCGSDACNASKCSKKTACEKGQCGKSAKNACANSDCDQAVAGCDANECGGNLGFQAWAGQFIRRMVEAKQMAEQPEPNPGEPTVAEFSRAVETVLADPRPTAVIVEAEDGVFVLTRGEEVGDILVTKYSADILDNLAKRAEPPACPERLDLSQPCKVDPELAAMQRAYLQSYREGLLAEARAVSEEMSRTTDALAAQPTVAPRRLPVEAPTHHQVGYQQEATTGAPYPQPAQPARPATVFLSEEKSAAWSSIRGRTVSCHFQGDTLAEAARFFHQATGMTVRVEGTGVKDANDAGVHVLCRDKSVEQCLRVVLGCCGYGYIIRGEEMILAPATEIEQIAGKNGKPIDAVWKP